MLVLYYGWILIHRKTMLISSCYRLGTSTSGNISPHHTLVLICKNRVHYNGTLLLPIWTKFLLFTKEQKFEMLLSSGKHRACCHADKSLLPIGYKRQTDATLNENKVRLSTAHSRW